MDVIAFDGPASNVATVGGKGLSLMRMTSAGFAVPPGFVLPVGFFEPWFVTLAQAGRDSESDGFTSLRDARDDASLAAACARLKQAASKLELTDAQRTALQKALDRFPMGTLFAVRSSSPEEDLDGSSFAGGYETVLGVQYDGIEDAVRRAFASCLDVRVAVYKREHGFDVSRPRIAIVVQKQVRSDSAGVGFSVDPISNDHDVAVFNANFGLGETVVAGIATPDLFSVDKLTRRILERRIGKKETSIWLAADGGTEERRDPKHAEAVLHDDAVLALTEQLVRIETHYGRPMDIEWAFEKGALYILQARPITTHRSLHPSMMTAPGEKRRLYLDATVSVQGVFEPLTPMAQDSWRALFGGASKGIFGNDTLSSPERSPIVVEGGRLWLHLSRILTIVPLEKIVGFLPIIDPVAAGSLATIQDESFYRADESIKPVPWRLLLGAPVHATHLMEARLAPKRARKAVNVVIDELPAELDRLAASDLPFDQMAREAVGKTARTMILDVLPLFVMAKLAMSKIRKLFPNPSEEETRFLSKLDQSLPGNVTVEMGLELADVAEHLPSDAPADLDELERRLAAGDLPQAFMERWRSFLARYGHRGPGEIDPSNPRYRDRPRTLLSQVVGLAKNPDPASAPKAVYERSQAERSEAARVLEERARQRGWLAARKFRSRYAVVEALGGLRETPKFALVTALARVRARALREADVLVAQKRLDDVNDVFWLGFDDLAKVLADPNIDARAKVAERRAELAHLAGRTEPPRIIDSRGKILRPAPQPLKEGELGGHPISPGVVRGRVKVLHTPDEKPLLPGEVLVARATDPGWTPLFVNAAAVVLEVGGVMQHGALVAREYGRACVAGVDAATKNLRDGELVEVDGSAGIVRRLDHAPPC